MFSPGKLRVALLLCITFVLFAAIEARAGVILQDSGPVGVAFGFSGFDPTGQSFTAEDPNVLFAFHFIAGNTFLVNVPITVSLYDGSGFGGTLLGSSTFSLPDLFQGYQDVDFTAIPLTIGNVYTARASTSNLYWTVSRTTTDVYSGGTGFQGPVVGNDFRFRVTPSSASVPEPHTLLLLALGLAVLVPLRRLLA